MRLLRVIVFLLLAGLAGLIGYAYFGDMAADPQPMRVPVELDLGQQPPAAPAVSAPAAPAADAAATDGAATDTPAAPPPARGGTDAALD